MGSCGSPFSWRITLCVMQRPPIKHCRECGTPVQYRLPDDGDTRERAICSACDTVHYENPLNVVGTVPWLGDREIGRAHV